MKKHFLTDRSSAFLAKRKPGFLPVNSAVSTLFTTPRFTLGVKGIAVPKVKSLKSHKEDITRLKKMLSEAMLDNGALQPALNQECLVRSRRRPPRPLHLYHQSDTRILRGVLLAGAPLFISTSPGYSPYTGEKPKIRFEQEPFRIDVFPWFSLDR